MQVTWLVVAIGSAVAALWIADLARQTSSRRFASVSGEIRRAQAVAADRRQSASQHGIGSGSRVGRALSSPKGRIRLAAASAGLAAFLFLGGVLGGIVGALVASLLPIGLGRLESSVQRDRRQALVRQAPEVADLLTACLAAGSPPAAAITAVARALGEPAAVPLRQVATALALGADPVVAWSALSGEPGLAALGRAIARSVDSGASLASVLPGVAEDLRRVARAEAETAAQAAGVKAVAPLGACFLPAFVLVGVVPLVASLAQGMLSTF